MVQWGAAAPSSFRDPAGFVFQENGVVKRAVTVYGAPDLELLTSSGLYDRLVAAGVLVAHQQEEPVSAAAAAEVVKVLVPEQIRYVSYPYEWCFGQLKDAALLTLKAQALALQHGMSLKDASAFNVQFRGPRPVLIDTLSFERNDGRPWVAYNQFCRHFLAPLLLTKYYGAALHPFWRASVEGFPLDLASRLLPCRSYLRFGTLIHLHAHAWSQRRHSKLPGPGEEASPAVPSGPDRKAALVESLQATIEGLSPGKPSSEWSDYYAHSTHYSAAAEEAKKAWVEEVLSRTAPQTVYDLGGNIGTYGRLATRRGIDCVCFDIDPACVHENYERSKRAGDLHMLPLVMDLTNPTPALGFGLRERMSLLERPQADLLLALALIHHLRITGNAPFRRIAGFLAGLGRRVLIEWVPKNDVMAAALLSVRKDTFIDYTQDQFLDAFAEHFEIEDSRPITDTARTLYLLRRRS